MQLKAMLKKNGLKENMSQEAIRKARERIELKRASKDLDTSVIIDPYRRSKRRRKQIDYVYPLEEDDDDEEEEDSSDNGASEQL